MTEAVFFEDLRPTTQMGTSINQGDGIPLRTEAKRCCNPAETATDDDRLMI